MRLHRVVVPIESTSEHTGIEGYCGSMRVYMEWLCRDLGKFRIWFGGLLYFNSIAIPGQFFSTSN